MTPAFELEQLREGFRAESLHTAAVSPDARRALLEIVADEEFAGASDPPTVALLSLLVRVRRPRGVLELGTHLGYSTIVIADCLRQNDFGHLNTVEPLEPLRKRAWSRAVEAGLEEWVTFLAGYSTGESVAEVMAEAAPFELVYLDSSHDEATTERELELLTREGGWLAPDGLLLLHDAARDGPAGSGVRRALDRWYRSAADRFQLLVLERPAWPGAPGVALITRR